MSTAPQPVDPAYAYNYVSFVYKGEEYVMPRYVLKEWEQHGRLGHSQIVALAGKRGYIWRRSSVNGQLYLTMFVETKTNAQTDVHKANAGERHVRRKPAAKASD